MRESDRARGPFVAGRTHVPENGAGPTSDDLQFKCYFIDRDGRGRSLATLRASDPASAVQLALAKFPPLRGRAVEVLKK
jgi:hypothetical protein